MKWKLTVGILSTAFILSAGTLTFAETNGDGTSIFNFEQMKPYIQEMHPNLSEEEQLEMFNRCHGENGMMRDFQDTEKPRDIMNNF